MKLGTYETLKIHHREMAHQIEFLFVLGGPETATFSNRFEADSIPDWLFARWTPQMATRFIDEMLQTLRFRAYRSAGFFLVADIEFNYEVMQRMEANGRFEI